MQIFYFENINFHSFSTKQLDYFSSSLHWKLVSSKKTGRDQFVEHLCSSNEMTPIFLCTKHNFFLISPEIYILIIILAHFVKNDSLTSLTEKNTKFSLARKYFKKSIYFRPQLPYTAVKITLKYNSDRGPNIFNSALI